ncbi:hypothetical protein Fmac_016412 [Flemingia macrophylla]|uniref:Uncharacterized protein n=1 Tax=Flemingia macrophylla TaxID=520843 RepID=A0ABD1MHC5_9FABA
MTETQPLSLKFTQLEQADEIAQNSAPKIQRRAHYLRDRKDFDKHYSPRLVSIGPIHHGAKNLQLGEKYKRMWTAMYLKRTKQYAQTLYHMIASNIKQLKELFAEDAIEAFADDEKLSWMLLVDGCALLQILEEGDLDKPEALKVKVGHLVLVWQDVLLLENQLPCQVLQLLSGHDDARLLQTMKKFLQYHHLWPAKKQDKGVDNALVEEGCISVHIENNDTLQGDMYFCSGAKGKKKDENSKSAGADSPQEPKVDESKESPPIHLLDQLRRSIVNDPPNQKHQDPEHMEVTYRNIEELRTVGIKLKPNESGRLTDISFSYRWWCLCADLKLPSITVDDNTAPTFLNLIAYEMCPDFKNKHEICSFVAFMDSLIDHPDDVKVLRKSKVLRNALGSDEEVAKLFNTMSTDLLSDTRSYSHVRIPIEKHSNNKWRTWITLAYHTYFSNPWAIIAFLAAAFALVLTFVQTWFTIHP